jgi:hypothetical protein
MNKIKVNKINNKKLIIIIIMEKNNNNLMINKVNQMIINKNFIKINIKILILI